MILIEATTGNAGISTAMIAAVKGYQAVICMPGGMSEERKKIIRAYGATIVETPGGESDVDLVMKKVREIMAEAPGRYWEVGQFTNPNNWQAHYHTTGPEIWRQTDGKVDAFIAPQGTGGTITGVAKYFHEQKAQTKFYAIEPAECPLLTKSQWGSHKIEGIGDGFIPETLDVSLLDGVVTTTSEEAINMARRLAREEGIFCGISSGCSVARAGTPHGRAHASTVEKVPEPLGGDRVGGGRWNKSSDDSRKGRGVPRGDDRLLARTHCDSLTKRPGKANRRARAAGNGTGWS